MKIIVNGQTMTVSENLTAIELLEELGMAGKKLALEINEEIIPRSSFTDHKINKADKIEIIHAIGGG